MFRQRDSIWCVWTWLEAMEPKPILPTPQCFCLMTCQQRHMKGCETSIWRRLGATTALWLVSLLGLAYKSMVRCWYLGNKAVIWCWVACDCTAETVVIESFLITRCIFDLVVVIFEHLVHNKGAKLVGDKFCSKECESCASPRNPTMSDVKRLRKQ